MPLLPATNRTSEAETRRVRLLSSAHNRQASAIAAGPSQSAASAPCTGQASTMPPATMTSMPAATRRLVCSRNTVQAIKAVSTASRLSSSDADAAEVRERPNISATGAATPPTAIAPASQRHSPGAKPEACQFRSRKSRVISKPRPLPIYSNPASNMGGTSPTSCLAAGVLAPNSAAAAMANTTLRSMGSLSRFHRTCVSGIGLRDHRVDSTTPVPARRSNPGAVSWNHFSRASLGSPHVGPATARQQRLIHIKLAPCRRCRLEPKRQVLCPTTHEPLEPPCRQANHCIRDAVRLGIDAWSGARECLPDRWTEVGATRSPQWMDVGVHGCHGRRRCRQRAYAESRRR
jgi:hypothetical protein